MGDYFSYYEVENLGNGTGSYYGYSERTIVNGTETIGGISGDGIVSAKYNFSWAWSNSTGGVNTGTASGNFTFSSVTFLYVNGTDNQTGYVTPTVWFWMNNSTQKGSAFELLNTEMTLKSRSYSYYLPSQSRNVGTIFAQGSSSYPRIYEHEQFMATYTWKAYFDQSTGYVVGYGYVEHDTNSSGDGFGYTDYLNVTSTSYTLTVAAAGNSGIAQYVGYIVAIVLVIVVVGILIYALSRRRRRLPEHPSQQPPVPAPGPPPEPVNFTPKQPPVQQIVIKEVVKVKCRYCGALIDSTAETCPLCGAPRT